MTVVPVRNMARILWYGTSRARWVATPSAPRSTSGSPNVASAAATTMSAFPAMPTPPPRQCPCTAAMTGTSQSYTAAKVSQQPRFTSINDRFVGSAASSLMSTPAWKAPSSGFADTIRARTSLSRPWPRIVSASSNQPLTGKALTGGLSMTTSATWSRTSERITRRAYRTARPGRVGRSGGPRPRSTTVGVRGRRTVT